MEVPAWVQAHPNGPGNRALVAHGPGLPGHKQGKVMRPQAGPQKSHAGRGPARDQKKGPSKGQDKGPW